MIGPAGENDAAMFDIDDTLIWTNGTPNTPIINLLHRMKDLGVSYYHYNGESWYSTCY